MIMRPVFDMSCPFLDDDGICTLGEVALKDCENFDEMEDKDD